RDKKQQAAFFFGPDMSFPLNYVDTHLQTWSITPRLSIKNSVLGVPSAILTGIDYYDANYHSDRPLFNGAAPIHVYDLSQQTLASSYIMDVNNEIHFDPVNSVNYTLAPARRYGVETATSLRLSDTLLVRGGAAYTRAVFREGPNMGNDVPLVSRFTANGGVTW